MHSEQAARRREAIRGWRADMAEQQREDELARNREAERVQGVTGQQREQNQQTQLQKANTAEQEHVAKLDHNRESQRISRANRTAEQRDAQLTGNREAARLRRANRTAEQRDAQLTRNREAARLRREAEHRRQADMTQEQRDAELQRKREAERCRQADRTEQQRDAELERRQETERRRQADMTQEQGDAELQRKREAERRRQADRTEQQRDAELECRRETERRRKADRTQEQRDAELQRTREAARRRQADRTEQQRDAELERRREAERRRQADRTQEQRDAELQRTREAERRRKADRTEQQRDAELERRREAERRRQANRTQDQRDAELQRTREAERRRQADRTQEQRDAELQHNREAERRRQANRTQEQRDAELQRTREAERRRQANRTQEQRDAELQHYREAERRRQADRTQEQRDAELQRTREAERRRKADRTQEQRDAELQRTREAERRRQADRTQEQRDAAANQRRQTARNRRAVNLENRRRQAANFRDEHNVPVFSVGAMEYVCTACKALMFRGETHRGILGVNAKFAMCCSYGSVELPPLMPPPNEILQLYIGDSPTDKEFRRNIRKYNSSLALSSVGVDLGGVFNFHGGLWVYKVNGQLYHALGTMEPAIDQPPRFSQLYVYDREHELDNRHHRNPDMRRDTLQRLQDAMHEHNPYARTFRQVSDIIHENPAQDVRLVLKAKGTPDPRRYNLPSGDDIAIVIPQVPESVQEPTGRDVVLYQNNAYNQNRYNTIHIDEFHQMYDPTAYPILFIHGDCGYDYESGLTRQTQGGNVRKMCTRPYYRYRFMERQNDVNILQRCGRLTQQYMADMWCKVEREELRYIRNNQPQLRAELYQGLADAVTNNVEQIGTRIVLPSTHTGSPRQMHELYQDAMALVRKYGKPELFITFTCNPKWPEITERLHPGQSTVDRQDVVSRVYQLKLKEFFNDLFTVGILGRVVAHCYTIEEQKRSLKHAHVLSILQQHITPDWIDTVVWAYIPDQNTMPRLHRVVTESMLHGPCGTSNPRCPCMVDGQCKAGYPKAFQEHTALNRDGYSLYARPDDGTVHVKNGFTYDNRWVVPYNPILLLKYDAHINVEVCGSVKNVKYLYKYITKGADMASVGVDANQPNEHVDQPNVDANEPHDPINPSNEPTNQSIDPPNEPITRPVAPPNDPTNQPNNPTNQPNDPTNQTNAPTNQPDDPTNQPNDATNQPNDPANPPAARIRRQAPNEIINYVKSRWITSSTAMWSMCEFSTHGRHPPVVRLAVHEENMQSVVFVEGNERAAVDRHRSTTLTAWMAYNILHPEARQYLYSQFPEHFRWNVQGKEWTARKNDQFSIARMYTTTPTHGERHYLRMLLHHVAGATCFADLRTLDDGTVLDTFKETAMRLGLLEDDAESEGCLREAADDAMPVQIRRLFAILLVYCKPSNPKHLWDLFKDVMGEDIRHRHTRGRTCFLTDEQVDNETLLSLESTLEVMGSTLADYEKMPKPTVSRIHGTERIILEEIYNVEQEQHRYDDSVTSLNPEQAVIVDTILAAVDDDNAPNRLFVVNAPGGCGKTYMFMTLLNGIRSRGYIALAVASTGLASENLQGGRTAHSRFKIPIPIFTNSMCKIPAQSDLAKLMRRAKVIVWDEAFASHRLGLESVDRSLKDIRKDERPFGGCVVVLGGDTRQILPVVRHGGEAAIINSCLKFSHLWQRFTKFALTQNMRVAAEEVEFAAYLLKIGHGQHEVVDHNIPHRLAIPPSYLVLHRDDLIEFVFPGLANGYEDVQFMANRSILTPYNEDVDAINRLCIDTFPGEERIYLSADKIDEGTALRIPTEYLNSLTPSGMPPHELRLKENSVVMLLKNLQAGSMEGLRNGTRLLIKTLGDRVLECEVLTGTSRGTRVLVPRIPFLLQESDFPFSMIRKQFPIRLAFAMTINKAQGQTLDRVGVYVLRPVFTHGQLYVAFSRVRNSESIRVCVSDTDDGCTSNIVYSAVL